jgi:hypothetical protein
MKNSLLKLRSILWNTLYSLKSFMHDEINSNQIISYIIAILFENDVIWSIGQYIISSFYHLHYNAWEIKKVSKQASNQASKQAITRPVDTERNYFPLSETPLLGTDGATRLKLTDKFVSFVCFIKCRLMDKSGGGEWCGWGWVADKEAWQQWTVITALIWRAGRNSASPLKLIVVSATEKVTGYRVP